MAEDSDARWAQEAYAFLALFRRVQNRLTGLLMMEVGWAVLLVLVAQLAGKDKTPVIGVPGINALQDIPLSSVFVPGAFLVLIWWLFTSSVFRLIKLLALRFLRPAASLILIASMYVLNLLNLIIVGVFYLHGFNKWKKQQDSQWLAENEPKLGENGMMQLYEDQTKPRVDIPYDIAAAWIGRTRFNCASAATIALSPFYSYSFEEEQKSAKAPTQIFATAITRLRLALGELRTIPHVSFVTMPDIIRIESDDVARTVVRRYGIDTLLWGSYISAEPPRIWLNIQSSPYPCEKTSRLGRETRLICSRRLI